MHWNLHIYLCSQLCQEQWISSPAISALLYCFSQYRSPGTLSYLSKHRLSASPPLVWCHSRLRRAVYFGVARTWKRGCLLRVIPVNWAVQHDFALHLKSAKPELGSFTFPKQWVRSKTKSDPREAVSDTKKETVWVMDWRVLLLNSPSKPQSEFFRARSKKRKKVVFFFAAFPYFRATEQRKRTREEIQSITKWSHTRSRRVSFAFCDHLFGWQKYQALLCRVTSNKSGMVECGVSGFPTFFDDQKILGNYSTDLEKNVLI